uniref:Uncharacterized protein n=1 Tax=Vespula pensylvanica TaxID=30213 RepID=A0A834UCZ0_VESPE|nr:hypothetical protein H0235_004703 [Vespula pensylvanica]
MDYVSGPRARIKADSAPVTLEPDSVEKLFRNKKLLISPSYLLGAASLVITLEINSSSTQTVCAFNFDAITRYAYISKKRQKEEAQHMYLLASRTTTSVQVHIPTHGIEHEFTEGEAETSVYTVHKRELPNPIDFVLARMCACELLRASLSYPILPYPTLYYPILSYPILFYPTTSL